MNTDIEQRLHASVAAHVERERAWLPRDRRGRWVVIEPDAGRYLTKFPAHVRQLADYASSRRAKRFSSLSQARAFAQQVNGHVARWRRVSPSGFPWKRVTPWQRALSTTAKQSLWLGRMICEEGCPDAP